MAVGAWAQKPQSPAAGQQGSLGTVRNDRNSTEPQVAPIAQTRDQNELVGCISGTGQKLVLTQPQLRRTYEMRGNTGLLQNSVGKMVKVTGRLVLGQISAFEVQQVEPIQDKCQYEQSAATLPATGKTGNAGKALDVTTTATVEQTTPGVQTERGEQQNPTKKESKKTGARPNAAEAPTASQGAPMNASANGQNPDNAQRVANAAQRAEIGHGQPTLGVKAQPNYSNAGKPDANAQAVAEQAQQDRGRASGSEKVLQGGGQQANAGRTTPQTAQSNGTAPVFTGCLAQIGKDVWLTEQGSSERFRVAGDASNLKDHLNHTVQIVGNKTGTNGPAIGASGNTATIHVQAIQDIAPTCTGK